MSEKIRPIHNFAIIAHIDHGKSTLADRLLELTGTVDKRQMREQFLDQLDLERERGITIKLQPVRMEYQGHILNLIDTPGHVDFAYEVSRSLSAVKGAVLLVDAVKGVQAQTLSNLQFAKDQGLTMIGAVNKIDLSNARVSETRQQAADLLGMAEKDIYLLSAKTGQGVPELLAALLGQVPREIGDNSQSLRALVFDSHFDNFKGVVAHIYLKNGELKKGEKIFLANSKAQAVAKELGWFKPMPAAKEILSAGEIGFVATGLKSVEDCRVGETIVKDLAVKPLAGYKEPLAKVFVSFYPYSDNDFVKLKDGLAKLKLNDAALFFEPETSEALGRGFRCGFLGLLHLEIILERLKREYGLQIITGIPSVNYQIVLTDNSQKNVYSPLALPEANKIKEFKEPWVRLEIITPDKYLGDIMTMMPERRAIYENTENLPGQEIILVYQVPLSEIIIDFYDKLKSISSGYASMSYQMIGWQASNLVRLDIMIAGHLEKAFSQIVPQEKVARIGRATVMKLKAILPRQLFKVSLQACAGQRIIAREDISALRKDVIAGLYGGDITRKKKLLEKQKKGKKRMKAGGRVEIPASVFTQMLKTT